MSTTETRNRSGLFVTTRLEAREVPSPQGETAPRNRSEEPGPEFDDDSNALFGFADDFNSESSLLACRLERPEPIPLEGVSVDATVRDFCSQVTLTQRYRNDEPHAVEAVYVFPIDETAAVCGFEAIIDGVHVVGHVEERERAFETYDEALVAGHGAYLLDQERPDVFTASIGNIPPGKEVLIRITYVTELGLEGDDLRFVLPTTVSPRYAPAEDRTGVGRPPAEAVNPPFAWQVPYGLELAVHLEMPSTIRALESPSHPLAIEMGGRCATVRLGERRSALDRDFVLLVRLEEPFKPRAWVESNGEEQVLMVAFQPQFETAQAPCEAVFVIDRSGSMDGTSIEEARTALQLCLRSLSKGCSFNIVGFGSTYQQLFHKSQPYNEENLRVAAAHVRSLEADLGGTEILPALQAVLESTPQEGLPRQLFILTDGEVTNTEAVIGLARRYASTARIFTFGIGAGASHHLVSGLARAGGGVAEFIYPGERVEPKVLRQLAKALSPSLTGVGLDWGGLEVTQAPCPIPPIFAGGRLLVYGFLRRTAEQGRALVSLTANGPTGRVEFAVPVSFAGAMTGRLIATLGAKVRLRELEEGSGDKQVRRGSLRRGSSEKLVAEEGVRLATQYGLCSKWTSFVAVERREQPTEGKMELRKVPVALTRGWGGLDRDVRMLAMARALTDRMIHADAQSSGFSSAALFLCSGPSEFLMEPSRSKPAHSWPGLRNLRLHSGRLQASAQDAYQQLILLQSADGSWKLNRELAEALAVPYEQIEKAPAGSTGDREMICRAWATALALAWLKRNCDDRADEWKLLAAKASDWLAHCPAKPPRGEDWLATAMDFLSRV